MDLLITCMAWIGPRINFNWDVLNLSAQVLEDTKELHFGCELHPIPTLREPVTMHGLWFSFVLIKTFRHVLSVLQKPMLQAVVTILSIVSLSLWAVV